MLNNNEFIGDDDIKRSSFPEWPTLIPTEESHSLGRHKSDAIRFQFKIVIFCVIFVVNILYFVKNFQQVFVHPQC